MTKIKNPKKRTVCSSSSESGNGIGNLVGSQLSTGVVVVKQPGMSSKSQRSQKKETIVGAHQVFEEMSEQVIESEDSKSCTLGNDDTESEQVSQPNSSMDQIEHTSKSFVDVVKPPTRHIELRKKVQINDQPDLGVMLDKSDFKPVGVPWSYSLLGYVVGSFPGKQALLQCCKEWGVRFRYAPHESKWLVFHFESEEDRKQVLDGGPYFIFNRPLILKKLPPMFDFSDDELRHVPVWVKVRKLPLELWTSSALSKILSMVGKPIRMDNRTADGTVVSFARALVEVDVSKTMINEICVRIQDDKLLKLELEFENLPPFCHNCLFIGHKTARCGEKKSEKPGKTIVQSTRRIHNKPYMHTGENQMKDDGNGGNVGKSDSNAPSEHAGKSDLQEVEQARKVRMASVVVIPSKEDVIHYNKDGYGREMEEDGFSPVVSRRSRRRKSREGRIFNRGRSMDDRNANRGETVELVSELVNKARSKADKADNGKEKIVNGGGAPGPSHSK